MQNNDRDGKFKSINYKLQILLSEMGFFTNIATKKIKFNPRPNKKTRKKTEPEKQVETPEFIDLHLDTTNKIDELIKNHEQQNINKEELIDKTTLTQIREPWSKTPRKSFFQPEIIHTNFEKNDSLFELESPPSFNQNIHTNNLTPLSNQVTSFNEPLTVENIDSVEKKDNPNLFAGLSIRINRNPNQTPTQKIKNSNPKSDLEKARQELERKKQELEEMQRLAKQKEEELKKKEEEEKELERLNKIKQKQLEKEQKIKEKQLRLEQIRQEKEQRILEKQRQIELEKQEKEKREIEEQLQIELEKQEKLKKIEEEKLRREQELKKMLKEQEEKEKLLAKQQKIEEITNKKSKEKYEKKILIKEQEITNEPEKKLDAKIEIKTQKQIKTDKTELADIDLSDEEVGQVFRLVDNLLEKLPEQIIIEFIKSKDYEIYEKVLSKYNKK